MQLSDAEAIGLADATGSALDDLLAAGAKVRDDAWGTQITYSPKVFLPLTNLCGNFCDYCCFRRSPGDPGAHTMTPDEVCDQLARAAKVGCTEALLCLGDRPERSFPGYRQQLGRWGFDSTVSYLVWCCEQALDRGLLPHTNAGVLPRADMLRLKPVNASLGLMLENVSERLCASGGPHHRAPDKHPARRLAMTREAGELRIPFTSGILLGIGETPAERVHSLLAIRDLHHEHHHIQEVIVQNFRAHPHTPMAEAAEPGDLDVARSIALARLLLAPEISVQAPPNLNPAAIELLLRAGINDLGGVSPLTPDYVNRLHPWPHLDVLADSCRAAGFALTPRMPIYPGYAGRPEFVAGRVQEALR